MLRSTCLATFLATVIFAAIFAAAGFGQTAAPAATAAVTTADAGQPAQAFDVNAAVEFYLAKMPAGERARSNAYFEGGYWLLFWDFLANAVAMWLLLHFGWSSGMRNFAEGMTRFRPLQTAIYWCLFFVANTVLVFPLAVYEGFFRERSYGLLNQNFGQWFRDQAVQLAIGGVLGAVLVIPLFGLVRKLGRTWWVWGSAVMILFVALVSLIAPVYMAPLFNTYTKLADSRVKDPILSMARANGIPATDVYEFDASRQSNRVSANVSGFASTMRISLNDNLLKRCTLAEIETTMGHEMGHYVLNHAYKGLVMIGVLIVIGFAFLDWSLKFSLARWGAQWGIRDIKDVAVIPLAVLLFSIFSFVTTPVSNTLTRTMEFEADMYGLNAARQPDGEANVDLLLGEYRKMDPGPVEEFLFYDHPSGRTRITAAMRWKAEHLDTASAEEMARVIFEGK